jgi:hypothetical protein
MADQNPAPTKPQESEQTKLVAPAGKPLSHDIEKELRAQIFQLQERLALAEQENKALADLLAEQDKARADAKLKKSAGPKVPVAIVPILGEGRRMVQPGAALKQSELDGLIEGQHFQLVDA